MPEFVQQKVYRQLNQLGIAPSCSKILMLGVAYKRDLGDWRESPALEIISLLLADGVDLAYYDSFVSTIQIRGRQLRSEPWEPDKLSTYDLVIITTDHSNVDYGQVARQSRSVLDTRGVTRRLAAEHLKKVTLL
jgi:UDP-N-acetyl-D-glucosamine dehydrogenase